MTSNDNDSTKPTVIKIGSRDSELALKQTNIVRDLLKEAHPDLNYEIQTMKTKGDKILNMSLFKIGSKSLFTKELEVALATNEVDILVHSLKDLPTSLPEGMVIGCICKREDPRDVVIMHPKFSSHTLSSLPSDSIVGTSSVRRTAQLRRNHPHLKYESIRGNLNTRFRKLDEADTYAAIVLAAAGVNRMGWSNRISEYLEKDSCMYAVGQGALAVECREDDNNILQLLSSLCHKSTMINAATERGCMATLEGGCSAPVAANAKVSDETLVVDGGVWSLDGKQELLHSLTCDLSTSKDENNDEGRPSKVARTSSSYSGIVPPREYKDCVAKAHNLGVELANELLKKGAKKILEDAKAENMLSEDSVINDKDDSANGNKDINPTKHPKINTSINKSFATNSSTDDVKDSTEVTS